MLIISVLILAAAIGGIVVWVKTAPDEDILYNRYVEKSTSTPEPEQDE